MMSFDPGCLPDAAGGGTFDGREDGRLRVAEQADEDLPTPDVLLRNCRVMNFGVDAGDVLGRLPGRAGGRPVEVASAGVRPERPVAQRRPEIRAGLWHGVRRVN